MTAPTCLLCDGRHWYSEPCDGEPVNNTVDKAVNKSVNKCPVNVDCLQCKVKDDKIAELESLLRKPDRKTYMREYMRRRRVQDLT